MSLKFSNKSLRQRTNLVLTKAYSPQTNVMSELFKKVYFESHKFNALFVKHVLFV